MTAMANTAGAAPERLVVAVAPEQLSRLLSGGCHLRGDEGLNGIVSGRQQLTVAVGGVRALVQHQAAGGHCQRHRQKLRACCHCIPLMCTHVCSTTKLSWQGP